MIAELFSIIGVTISEEVANGASAGLLIAGVLLGTHLAIQILFKITR